jgi:phosphoglycerate dehydrogenase-like enzyme
MTRIAVPHDFPSSVFEEEVRKRQPNVSIMTGRDLDDTVRKLEDASALVTTNGSWHDAYLTSLDSGNWIQCGSSGLNRLPTDELSERRVKLASASGVSVAPASEYVFMFALVFSRSVPELLVEQERREWADPMVSDWAGDRLTILGLGAIGEGIARRGRGFEMDVAGVKQHPESYNGCLDAGEIHPPDRFGDLLSDIDLLAVAAPLTDETRGMVDRQVLATLPATAIVVNVGRGEIVDQPALIEALGSDSIGGADLDVFVEEPLPEELPRWDMENALVTPHAAGASEKNTERLLYLFGRNLGRWRHDEPLINEV